MLMTLPKSVLKSVPKHHGLILRTRPESVFSDVLPMSTVRTRLNSVLAPVPFGTLLPMTRPHSVWVSALLTHLPTAEPWDVSSNVLQAHTPTIQPGDALLNVPKTQHCTRTRQSTSVWSTAHQTFTATTWQERVWTNVPKIQCISHTSQQTDATRTVCIHTLESRTLESACWVVTGESTRTCHHTDAKSAHHPAHHAWANWVARHA